MSKNCRTCKYFNMGKCKCREFLNSVKAQNTNDGYSYTEDGRIYDVLRESNAIKNIVESIFNDLLQKEIIKKNKKFKNYNYEDIEINLLEEIDEALSPSINKYFDGKVNSLSISDPDNFSCCYWE